MVFYVLLKLNILELQEFENITTLKTETDNKQKMRKYPSDIGVSENCIDSNLSTVEKREPDSFLCFPPQERCAWEIPEIVLKVEINGLDFSLTASRLKCVIENYILIYQPKLVVCIQKKRLSVTVVLSTKNIKMTILRSKFC